MEHYLFQKHVWHETLFLEKKPWNSANFVKNKYIINFTLASKVDNYHRKLNIQGFGLWCLTPLSNIQRYTFTTV